ncbi:hypothetical protein BZA05DRAFT_270382 [Tricharina praecox]|uniref:uncharacterized protein n=1 Tax=Tricharina praecox TaxID=43433 RepID=UPI002220E5B7|nr:uncharacterized protein BZA05DRAFT_270382 [Tricharina praecox]KAI5853813.1 hypothetical protein BZA05DRAFT_270382 [Tricharina praecox]
MVPNSARRSSMAPSSQLSLVSSSPGFDRGGVGLSNPASDNSVSSGFPMTSSPYAAAAASTGPSQRPRARQYHRCTNTTTTTNNNSNNNSNIEIHPATRQLREPEEAEPASGQLQQEQSDARSEGVPSLPHESKSQHTTVTTQSHNTYTFTKKGFIMPTAAVTASTATTIQHETKMTTSAAHRRLQDVLNGPVIAPAAIEEPVLPPPLASTNPRRTPSTSTSASANQLPPPPRLLRRSSSAIRLTTSLEGKATVVLEDAPPSSPPKQLPTPGPRTARRRPLSTPVDSSLWEFCCDNQSAIRSPAATPPQPSEATQALRLLRTRRNTIGSLPTLLRTLSQTQPITAAATTTTTSTNTTNTTNTTAIRKDEFVKPTPVKKKPQPALPSLSEKKKSSVSKPLAAKTPAKKTPSKTPSKPPLKKQQQDRKVITSTKKASRPKPLTGSFSRNRKDFGSFESLDSDKENHPPGASFSPPPDPPKRRALGVAGKGALNGTSTATSVKKPKSKPSTSSSNRRPSTYDIVDEGYGASQESISFGGHENESQDAELFVDGQDGGFGSTVRLASPRRVDELECVENLLSLRGGTWR